MWAERGLSIHVVLGHTLVKVLVTRIWHKRPLRSCNLLLGDIFERHVRRWGHGTGSPGSISWTRRRRERDLPRAVPSTISSERGFRWDAFAPGSVSTGEGWHGHVCGERNGGNSHSYRNDWRTSHRGVGENVVTRNCWHNGRERHWGVDIGHFLFAVFVDHNRCTGRGHGGKCELVTRDTVERRKARLQHRNGIVIARDDWDRCLSFDCTRGASDIWQ